MTNRVVVTLLRLSFWAAVLFACVMATLPQPPEVPGGPSDKLLHVVAFATLALLGGLAYPRLSLIKLTLALSALGAGIELVQAIPALHRDSEFRDWIADTATVAVVLLVLFLWRQLLKAS
jgi:VanZ family protein